MEAVEWIDSGMHIDQGWAELEVYRSVAKQWNGRVTTVGIPIYEDDRMLVLALSRDDANGNAFGAQLIALSAIVKRTVLVPAEN